MLDPPAFAKTRAALPAALRGYKEINLRAMRLLSPGGLLFTASCSFHLTKPLFLEMLDDAAADSGRRIVLRELRGQPLDHPEVLTIPETGYIKGALLEAPTSGALMYSRSAFTLAVGQKYVERPACMIRSIGVLHRRQGFPSRSYTSRPTVLSSVYRAPVARLSTAAIALRSFFTCATLSDVARMPRIDLRAPQRLGRVDVPEPRHDRLIEQRRLDRSPRVASAARSCSAVHASSDASGPRPRSSAIAGSVQLERAERARVDEDERVRHR